MEQALILVEPSEVSAAGRLEKVLAVFGVPSRSTGVAEFSAAAVAGDDQSKIRLLATPAAFLKLIEKLEAGTGWKNKIHSAFVFAGNDPASFEKLVRRMTGDAKVSLAKVNPGAEWIVSGQMPEFCRSMSGVRAAVSNHSETALVLDESHVVATKIVSTKDGAAFVRLEFQSVPFFLSSADVIDVDAPLPARVFDVRPHFSAAVPVVLYVKWAFAKTCWQPPETTACLVIDDPLLRPRYGFLNFQRLLELMERVNFSTNVAFIPWNWNRSAGKTVQLFRDNPRRFSLSVHGCDHTGGEFGSRNGGRLAWKTRQALRRMERHQSRTGLPHDMVMVFPQGVFSETAMAVLKRGGLIGAVNSEVISADPQPRTIKIADYWDMAVMNYSDFPIFTRRYPWAGVENFAFDILLGKPCLVVVHHNDCHDDCRHIMAFMERLNRLNAPLRWTSLAEVVRRSFQWRKTESGAVEVKMYGGEARIENHSGEKKLFRIRKRESAPEAIKEIQVASQPVRWSAVDNHVTFEFELNPGETKAVAVSFHEPAPEGFAGDSLRYRAKAMLRRYLCEIRDNYVMRKSFSQ